MLEDVRLPRLGTSEGTTWNKSKSYVDIVFSCWQICTYIYIEIRVDFPSNNMEKRARLPGHWVSAALPGWAADARSIALGSRYRLSREADLSARQLAN